MGRTVDVAVGPKGVISSVHEKLIRASSPFFNKALSGAWQESQERTVQLPEDEPEIFAIYVHWLYYGTVPVVCHEAGDSNDADAEYLNLAKAYTLGDKLMDTKFQDATIDAIVEASNIINTNGTSWYPGTEVVQFVYDNTNESASIRTLLVDMFLMAGSGAWLLECKDRASVPQPFLFELASELLDLRGGAWPKIVASEYHIHGSKDALKAEAAEKNGP